MIYKFKKESNILEIESLNNLDGIVISMEDHTEDYIEIVLNKDDVYKLIGALHLLHKELKDE